MNYFLESGIGSQRKALENMGIPHEVIGISEIDKYAITAYEAIHGKTKNYGDISKIDKLDYADLLIYSSPCFPAGTMVLTSDGYKSIENITIEDDVLTHKNRYRQVLKTMNRYTDEIYEINTMVSDKIFTTKEHPFLVRKRSRTTCIEDGKKKNIRKFDKPDWVEAKNLSNEYYVGTAINQESIIPEWDGTTLHWSDGRRKRYSNVIKNKFTLKEFWWIIGRYMGDGWIKNSGGIIICCAKDEINEITPKLDYLEFNYSISNEKTVSKIHISIKEIGEYCEQFGRGALNKKITSDILNLPISLLEYFIKGYISADGCFTQNKFKATSVSRQLIYGIGQCIAKVYKTPFSIYEIVRHPSHLIEGRIVNQHNSYNISYKLNKGKQDQAFYEDGYIWSPIRKINVINHKCKVYNFEVEEDNSYVVQNIIVHNCQDFSNSGKQKGLYNEDGTKTRSGLLLEVQRLLDLAKVNNELPKWLLMENVKGLISKKFKPDFDKWLEYLDDLGYNNYWSVLNGKDFSIPQNRERVFVVSIRKDIDNGSFKFPKGFDNGIRLKDILEPIVDEKYYLSKEIQERFKYQLTGENIVGSTKGDNCTRHGQRDVVYNTNGIMGALNATDYKQPKQILDNSLKQVGMLDIKGNEQIRRVYSEEGCSPTLSTMQGGNRQPKVLQKEYHIVASRGRNPDNTSDRMVSNPTEQRLEINKNGISNTITTVQKDNYVLELDYIVGSTQKNAFVGNGDFSPTLTEAMGKGGGQVPMISFKNPIVYDDQNHRIKSDQSCVNTIMTKNCPHYNSRIIENQRVRKLTPLETWRLMGFEDSDFEKARQALNDTYYNGKDRSSSQLYCQSGNSIVVQVLEAIFTNLFKEYLSG